MAILSSRDLKIAEAIGQIGYCNPFLPERLTLERAALGEDFCCADPVINLPPDADLQTIFPNFIALRERAEVLSETMRRKLLSGAAPTERELQVYQNMTLYLLYNRHLAYLNTIATTPVDRSKTAQSSAAWKDFQKDFASYLQLPGLPLPKHFEARHSFAVFFQIQRAFNQIFACIIGRSMPIARLRAAVWESIFTHDLGRYARAIYKSMGSIPTLITGSSGTGKELVARAIGMSRYIEFDENSSRFKVDANSSLHSVNLSALSPTLIESELFGHRKGSFSGAVADRAGWLEVAGEQGTVFLDEIGELDLSIQVKLLRVLQSGTFSRVGDTEERKFAGKFVVATNRDLSREMAAGRFREDLYYRLCADMIQTPTLREQIADCPDDLHCLAEFIARRVLTDLPEEAKALAIEAVDWIAVQMGPNYAWPGNIRELEQCVRNVMIRKSYTPVRQSPMPVDGSEHDQFARDVAAGRFTLEELIEQYVSMIYAAEECHYGRASKRLNLDWRTLKQKLNPELVKTFTTR
jgi:sigma-54 specific flagellar transcriptional regulator A